MSGADETVVTTIPALGRCLTVGDLYNIHTGEIGVNPVQGQCITVDKAVRKTLPPIICPASEMYEKFNVSDEGRLDLLVEPKLLSGSAEVLSRGADIKEQVLLIHTKITEERKIEDAVSLDDNRQFNHQIISAIYGIRTVLLFETTRRKSKKTPNLIDIVTKLAKISQPGLHKLDSKEKDLCKYVKVTVFADVPCKQVINSAEEAAKFYQQLEEMTDEGDGIVLIVKLSQLGRRIYPPIPHELITGLNEFLVAITDSLKTCLHLYDKDVLDEFLTIKEKIRRFSRGITYFLEKLRCMLGRVLYQVRRGDMEVAELKTILDEVNNSPFHMNIGYNDILQNWIGEQIKLCGILEEIYDSRKKNVRLMSEDNSDKVSPDPKAGNRAVFYLGMTAEENEHLKNMAECAHVFFQDDNDHTSEAELLNLYTGSANSQNEKLRDFMTLAEKSEYQFVVSEERPATGAKTGGQVRVFQQGVLVDNDFILPSRLPAPEILETHYDRVIFAVNAQTASIVGYEVETENYFRYKMCHGVRGKPGNITVNKLESGMGYRVRFRCKTILGPSKFSPQETFVTAPSEAPDKPTALQVSETGCLVLWNRPQSMASLARSRNSMWEIEISWDGDSKTTFGDSLSIHLDLMPNTQYQFKVRAVYRVAYANARFTSVSVYSKPSEMFQLSASEIQIAKNKSLLRSRVVQQGYPAIHQLVMKNDYRNPFKRLERLTFGPSDSIKPMKTILVVGATGAGKSTLINAFANYLLGVKFEDEYRFRIIDERMDADQSVSQTKWVTAYVLYHQATFPEELPYSLTIIDTPGFGDTQGIKADKEITDQLSEYFHSRGHEGIDSLDAVGFVVQAALPRLTPTQQYIFDSILALFGNDVQDNIFILITFADGKKPPVVAALDKAKIPYTKSFKFNNSALFADRIAPDAYQGSDEDSDDERSFDENYWKMGVSSYKKFLSQLSKTPPKSLTLTNQVLDERERLEVHVSGIQQQITEALCKQENLRACLDCLKQHQTDIDRNKEFTFVVPVQKVEAVPLPRGQHVTNCLTCNRTCHFPCQIPNNEQKYGCAAMDHSAGLDAMCRVCPGGGCHWSVHQNTPQRIEVRTVEEKRTVSEMKQQYQEACQESLTTEALIMKIIDDIVTQEMYTGSLVEEVRESLKNLSQIALRPNHMTTTGYIDTLIDSEKHQACPGWQMRVRQLRAVRERAETTRQIAEYSGNTVPWQEIKKTVEENSGKHKGGIITSATDVIQKMFASAVMWYGRWGKHSN